MGTIVNSDRYDEAIEWLSARDKTGMWHTYQYYTLSKPGAFYDIDIFNKQIAIEFELVFGNS